MVRRGRGEAGGVGRARSRIKNTVSQYLPQSGGASMEGPRVPVRQVDLEEHETYGTVFRCLRRSSAASMVQLEEYEI